MWFSWLIFITINKVIYSKEYSGQTTDLYDDFKGRQAGRQVSLSAWFAATQSVYLL